LIYGIFAQASHISLFTFRFAADDSRRTAARSTKKIEVSTVEKSKGYGKKYG